MAGEHEECRIRFDVAGIVQGVGFRPFVHAQATRLGLSGYVRNDSHGVVVEVQGSVAGVGQFRAALMQDPPPLAVIDRISELAVEPTDDRAGFHILHSEHAGVASAVIAPDVATCDDCLAEMWDPGDRRYLYPFINCTNCGPRFTISTAIPYDRPKTTMAPFEMCSQCRAEYTDPTDRRFHAQPVACPDCGPQLRLLDSRLSPRGGDPIEETARLILGSAVVAVKGLGGYHLACLASREPAVRNLRQRKAREEKPLALMAADLDQVRALVELSAEHEQLLVSRRRPIVLMDRRSGAAVAPSVAPGNRYLGVMLPYTPLHHLLLEAVGEPVVLTSGNLSDEPIAYRDEHAFEGLGRIADAFLTHNRDIHMRCDDSVVRLAPASGGTAGEQMIRRARGYAPEPITVTPAFQQPILAAGPELKHTFCIGSGRRAILSHHIGDLENWEAMSSFLESVEHYQRVFEVRPRVVAYDLHPEYLVTKWAKDLPDVRLIGVQHHHAHIASCLADNRRDEPVVGLALDGTGYGEDGTLWGCEVLVGDLAGYERYTHLRTMPLPGGAAAIKEPWRMAAVYLEAAFGASAADLELDFVRRTAHRWKPILQMARSGLNAPQSSSAGRLFDAAACLLGERDRVSYEGQAAIELEQAADPSVTAAYPCPVAGGVIDGPELIGALAEDLAAGCEVAEAAARFHNGFAWALVEVAVRAAQDAGLGVVALSGGTFQNQLLSRRVVAELTDRGLEVLTHQRVPANDGGISLGQAAVANKRLAEEAS